MVPRTEEETLQPNLLWSPSSALLHNSQMTQFAKFVSEKRFSPQLVTQSKDQKPMACYPALYKYSISRLSDFWADVIEFTQLIHTPSSACTVDEQSLMDSFPEWFPGLRMNFTENLLRHCDTMPDHVAFYLCTEANDVISKVSFAELKRRVHVTMAAMRKAGVRKDDCVAGYLPNSADAVIAVLAAASLGAVWSSVSPDFGVSGVLERFSQIRPKLLFAVNAVIYNGKCHDQMEKLKEIATSLQSQGLEKVIIIHYFKANSMKLDMVPLSVSLETFLSTAPQPLPPLQFERFPFQHPVYILFSSGTTGKPKCIVHGAGGTLLQHLKEHSIHGNLGPSDIFFQVSTVGWMMFFWMISALALGTSLVLYDGSPFKPTPDALLQCIRRTKTTVFGTSAKYLQMLQKYLPTLPSPMESLHSIYSTGSPLHPESFDYVYQQIQPNALLGSITGGTDIISLFMGHNTNLPVFRGEIQCKCLGMAVEAWNESGQSVFGVPGDLVCTKIFPCMPVKFLNDPHYEKYKSAYFQQFPHVWAHGDFVLFNPNTGGAVMLGRSDGTLNPGGVRFGSADLYNIVETFSEVADSLVVSQKKKDDNDERVCMFLQMVSGHSLTPELKEKISNVIRQQLSPRHVPAIIVSVPEIPYTVNGKKVEIAVKRIISGESIIPSGTLQNPQSLEIFYKIPELYTF